MRSVTCGGMRSEGGFGSPGKTLTFQDDPMPPRVTDLIESVDSVTVSFESWG